MNTRLALAVSLAVSMTSAVSAETIKIKGMYLGMTVDNAVVALSKAMSIPAADLIVVKLDDGVKSCIFTPGLKEDFVKDPKGDKALCNFTHGNPAAMLAMMQQDVIRSFAAALKSESNTNTAIRQIAPLATFTNDSMITMTLQSEVVDEIFSYGQSDFKTFATGFINAYGIPTLNRVNCTFEQQKMCWDYSDSNGTLVTMLDSPSVAPIIQMFKTKPLKF